MQDPPPPLFLHPFYAFWFRYVCHCSDTSIHWIVRVDSSHHPTLVWSATAIKGSGRVNQLTHTENDTNRTIRSRQDSHHQITVSRRITMDDTVKMEDIPNSIQPQANSNSNSQPEHATTPEKTEPHHAMDANPIVSLWLWGLTSSYEKSTMHMLIPTTVTEKGKNLPQRG